VAIEWNWLGVPYLVCALSLAAIGIVAALIRGDRVLRLGTIGASISSLPWAASSALAACTRDPELAERLLRLGNAPLALVGVCFLLVLLGVTGQLERHRWIAFGSAAVGALLTALCLVTPWIVAGVRALPSGVFYLEPGPLAGLHFSQLGIWLVIGIAIARRSILGGARRDLVRVIIAVFVLCTIGATDILILYGVAGSFPISWVSATIAALITVYYELRSDLLRPQGLDRAALSEFAALALVVVLAGAAAAWGVRSPVVISVAGSLLWSIALGVLWARRQARPVAIASERALEQFASSVGELDHEPRILERLRALWQEIGVEVQALLRVDGDRLVDVVSGAPRELERDVAAWLTAHGELLAAADLGTMRLGAIRPKLEALAAGATALVVPLMDRGALVGLVEASCARALREDERGLVIESARTAARALTYAALSKVAARERETAREVEVAEAMRLSASASRDDELGLWSVAAEYRTAPHTTGAGWSANLLADGRLAVLVTEAQAHGVAAALATAALTGAFAASTSGSAPVDLDGLLTSMRASSEGVVRGGEPVAAFLAILDPDARTIAWACAGHPGGAVAAADGGRAPVLLGGGGARLGASLVVATRGQAALPDDALLVVASSGARGDDDDARFLRALREVAPAGPRAAALLVDAAARAGAVHEDLLAVVVRRRLERRSMPVVRPPPS
jgi:Stage II sporulation protein E (SpoIIE)